MVFLFFFLREREKYIVDKFSLQEEKRKDKQVNTKVLIVFGWVEPGKSFFSLQEEKKKVKKGGERETKPSL